MACAILLATSSVALAKDDGKDYPVLDKGEPSPFKGILFTEQQARNASNAVTDAELDRAKCQIEKNRLGEACQATTDGIKMQAEADRKMIMSGLHICEYNLNECKKQDTWMRKNGAFLTGGAGLLATVATGMVCYLGNTEACLYSMGGGVAVVGGTLLLTVIF